jgi:hypothetical protein
MIDAPETIWAAQHPYGNIEAVDTECLGTTSYTRTDHSQALIAAAERRGMERAAGIARYAGAVQHPADGSYSHHDPVMGPDIEAAIRAAMEGTT